VPAAAAAVVLILAIGIGIVSQTGLHFGGGASTTSSQAGGAQYNASAPGAFGRLPSPALASGVADTGGPKAVSPSQSAESNVYLGPARLVWAGQFNVQVPTAPVYRYQEPTASQAGQFAVSLGAAPAKSTSTGPGYLGTYDGRDFTLSVSSSWTPPSPEPRFFLLPTGTSASGSDPKAVATAFLAKYGLVPPWPNLVDVRSSGNQVRVQFLRGFQLPGGDVAYLVGMFGERYGIDVLLEGGRLVTADGPLPLKLDVASYPLISGTQAVQEAVASSAPASAPTIQLTNAELVYALAYAGDHSFYEPAYLFSGTFTQNGTTFVKRVLVPAVGPQ
jgi:hypothetical protein